MVWICLNNEEWESIVGRSQTRLQQCLNHAEGPRDPISRWLTLESPLSTNDAILNKDLTSLKMILHVKKEDWGLPLANGMLSCKSSCYENMDRFSW